MSRPSAGATRRQRRGVDIAIVAAAVVFTTSSCSGAPGSELTLPDRGHGAGCGKLQPGQEGEAISFGLDTFTLHGPSVRITDVRLGGLTPPGMLSLTDLVWAPFPAGGTQIGIGASWDSVAGELGVASDHPVVQNDIELDANPMSNLDQWQLVVGVTPHGTGGAAKTIVVDYTTSDGHHRTITSHDSVGVFSTERGCDVIS